MDIGRGPVNSDSFEMGKDGVCMDADVGQIIRGHGHGIARREKDGLDSSSVLPFCFLKVFFDLPDRAYSEWRTFLVDHAEGTLVMGTTDRRLDKKTVRFARRPIYGTLIPHTQFENLRRKKCSQLLPLGWTQGYCTAGI
jgi:hypothetical protein